MPTVASAPLNSAVMSLPLFPEFPEIPKTEKRGALLTSGAWARTKSLEQPATPIHALVSRQLAPATFDRQQHGCRHEDR